MKPIIKFFILVVFLLLANEVSAESKEVTMMVGETQTLYLPSSVTSKNLRSVNFYSNGISYVQVLSYTNYSVKVKAIKAFSSPIIVRCDYYYLINNGGYIYQASGYYDFVITVVGENDNKVKPTRITFPTSAVGIEVGESRQLTPTVYPADAEYTLTWSINDKSVATISQSGLLIGKSEGEADLTVKADNGVYAMLRVVVSKPSPSSVAVSPSSLDLKVGDEKYLTASVYPSSANQKVTWSTNNADIAIVNSSGKVTAVGDGNCTIIVKTSNNLTARCTVKVSPKDVLPTSISLVPETATIEVGGTIPLIPTILPTNATTTLSWDSSDNSIASVSNGLVTGLSEGTCNITVMTSNGLCATSAIVVKAKEVLPTAVSLSAESLNLKVGEEAMLSASIFPENAVAILTWESSDNEIATINEGMVLAKNEGSCDIKVSTQNGLSATCHVLVEKPLLLPESIALSDTFLELIVGDIKYLQANVLPVDAVVELTWSSSDETVASVQEGEIQALSQGNCTITVTTQNGLVASCEVVVKGENPIIEPVPDWSGSYKMKAEVDRSEGIGYTYPKEFAMEIVKGSDDDYYITSFIGFNSAKSYPYTGLKLKVISGTQATIDLDYCYNVGSWTVDDNYIEGLHILSADSNFSYSSLSTINFTRNEDNELAISDFYVYYFGKETNYEYSQEVHYSGCTTIPENSGLEDVFNGEQVCDMVEIYSVNGRCIYVGKEDQVPMLENGIYIKRKGRTAIKLFICK